MKRKYAMAAIALGSMLAVSSAAFAEDTDESVNVETVTENSSETSADYEVINSYDNTDELAEQFTVKYPTTIETEMEKNIQNRLLTGFANWNQGYEAWEEWGNILYTEDSLYNLHGAHMTLKEYQASQQAGLSAADIQMGNFNLMLVCGDWCAINYDFSNTDFATGETTDGTVTEFVHFADYGEELGTRVVEGWACSKTSPNFETMAYFQSEESLAEQQAILDSVVNYEMPETDNLEEKYAVMNETPDHGDMADAIRSAILNDFESWNSGYETWSAAADEYFAENLSYKQKDGTELTLEEYKAFAKDEIENEQLTRLYFDNMLISDDWAGIHYRFTTVNANGEKEANDLMQFLHFTQEDDGSLKVDMVITK